MLLDVPPTSIPEVAASSSNPCGLPDDYVPPWGTALIPEAEWVDGVIGAGHSPLNIGECPPPPPKPGELVIEAFDFRFEGTRHREPNRRKVILHSHHVRDCYVAHSTEDFRPEIAVELDLRVDGLVRDALLTEPTQQSALRACVWRAVTRIEVWAEEDGDGARIAYRYRAFFAP